MASYFIEIAMFLIWLVIHGRALSTSPKHGQLNVGVMLVQKEAALKDVTQCLTSVATVFSLV